MKPLSLSMAIPWTCDVGHGPVSRWFRQAGAVPCGVEPSGDDGPV